MTAPSIRTPEYDALERAFLEASTEVRYLIETHAGPDIIAAFEREMAARADALCAHPHNGWLKEPTRIAANRAAVERALNDLPRQ